MAGQIFNLKRYFGGGDNPNQNQQIPQYPQMDPNGFYPVAQQPQQMQQMPMQNGYYPQQMIPQQGQMMPMQPAQQMTQQPMPQEGMMGESSVPSGEPTAGAEGSPMDPAKREGISMLTHFSQRLNTCIAQAAQQATAMHQAFIEPEHLLFGLFYDQTIFKLIQDLGGSPTAIQEEIKKTFQAGNSNAVPTFSASLKTVLDLAWREAKKRNEDFVTPEHALFALFSSNNKAMLDVLSKNGITKDSLDKKFVGNQPLAKKEGLSALEEYGTDLTEKAKEGQLDPVIGRDKEIERILHILSRRTKNNPVLIGEAGVGKTAVVEGLAQLIVKGDVPLDMKNKRIISLDLTAIIAGATHRGEFEERLKKLIKEVQLAQGAIILYIDEIHNMMGAGSGEGSMDASNILKPNLARGEIQVIGTTTIDEFRRYIEKDPALERRFQQVLIDEPSVEVAIDMLKGIKGKYESFHHVTISDKVIEEAVKLSKRYIGDRFLPDKAIDLIDEAGSKAKLSDAAKNGQTVELTVQDIESIVANWTGIPVTKLTETESARLLNLENLIHQRLIDQEGAVSAIAEAVRRGRAGLKSTNRPIGSFLFMGPTGTGKTELAKTLAEVLFGSDTLMIRLDMTEYMEKHEVAKLIGAPPGYVGYEEGGQLTEAVRTKPYSVLLLDEIEKAHPDVFNILLQILDDGRLTDNKGRTISFKNTIIICTSNAGSRLIQAEDLQGSENEQVIHMGNKRTKSDKPPTKFELLAQKLLAELQKFFKPEILNRFDEIIVFKPLTQEHMMQIAAINIKSTQKLLKEQNLDIEISQAALRKLAEVGFDPVFGARPLRRAIQTEVENPISTKIIDKTFAEGDTIMVDYDGTKDEFTFTKKQGGTNTSQLGQAGQPGVANPNDPNNLQNPTGQQMQPGQPMQTMNNAQINPAGQSMNSSQPNQSNSSDNPFAALNNMQPNMPSNPMGLAQNTSQSGGLYAKINGGQNAS